MTTAPRGSKLSKFINHRVSVSINDHRHFVGQLLGFDSHSNIVIKDCEEYRQLKKRNAGESREVKRNIGLMVLRGDTVVHVDVIGPPPPSGNRLSASTASAVLQPGISQDKVISKGTGISGQKEPSVSLSKPAPGVGTASAALKAAPSILPPSALPQ